MCVEKSVRAEKIVRKPKVSWEKRKIGRGRSYSYNVARMELGIIFDRVRGVHTITLG